MRKIPLAIDTARRPPARRGGWRPGAGRPKSAASKHAHTRRAPLSHRHPVHVTWRVVAGTPSLRSRRAFRVIRDAFTAAAKRFGLSLCEFSVQSNHVHLIVEAAHRPALSKGLQALGVRLARRLNRVFGRSGKLLADRFHAHVLTSPREVLHAVRYVRSNHLHHRNQRDARRRARAASMFPGTTVDHCSSRWVDNGVPMRFARTWLLRRAVNQLALPP